MEENKEHKNMQNRRREIEKRRRRKKRIDKDAKATEGRGRKEKEELLKEFIAIRRCIATFISINEHLLQLPEPRLECRKTIKKC